MNPLFKLFILIIGGILVVTGIFMLIKPDYARRRLTQVGGKEATWWLLMAAFFVISILFSLSKTIGGTLTLSGVVAVVAAFFILRQKAIAQIAALAGKLDLKGLRICALVQITIGMLMIILQRKII